MCFTQYLCSPSTFEYKKQNNTLNKRKQHTTTLAVCTALCVIKPISALESIVQHNCVLLHRPNKPLNKYTQRIQLKTRRRQLCRFFSLTHSLKLPIYVLILHHTRLHSTVQIVGWLESRFFVVFVRLDAPICTVHVLYFFFFFSVTIKKG